MFSLPRLRRWAWVLFALTACSGHNNEEGAGGASAGSATAEAGVGGATSSRATGATASGVSSSTSSTSTGGINASDGTGGASATSSSAGPMSGTGASGSGGALETPGVRIVGRTTLGTLGPRFEWPGTSISARFTGTQVSIRLSNAGDENSFEIVVDGGTPKKMTMATGTSTTQLAAGLAKGTHDLLVWRDTEAYVGATEFVGLTDFDSDGALLAPPPAPSRRLEVIGDSISCGYGIEGTSDCTTSTNAMENNYLAYGPVAARALGADLITIAWSGIGMWRNYDSKTASLDAMPMRYDFVLPLESSTKWDFSEYQPDAVIINLTSNDFSTYQDPGMDYVNAYVAFVQHLRSVYPNAYIVCVLEWPRDNADVRTDQIVSAVKAAGDTRIEAFSIIDYANWNGCQEHPDVAGGVTMGNALATEIKKILGW